MKATQQRFGLCKKVRVLSLLAAFGTVYAQEDDDDAALQALKTPDSQFSLGLSVPSATGSGASRRVSATPRSPTSTAGATPTCSTNSGST